MGWRVRVVLVLSVGAAACAAVLGVGEVQYSNGPDASTTDGASDAGTDTDLPRCGASGDCDGAECFEGVCGGRQLVQVTTATRTVCARRRSGSVWCWGSGVQGQLGEAGASGPEPRRIPVIDDAVDVQGGNGFFCALRADKTVWCWGTNLWGQLGHGPSIDPGLFNPTPVAVDGLKNVNQLSVGFEHACAVTAERDAWCWGNTSGQAPNTDAAAQFAPVLVTSGVVGVFAGRTLTCVDRASVLECAGNLAIGLGVPVPAWTTVTGFGLTATPQVALGSDRACALAGNGTVCCFGDGTWGGDASAPMQAQCSLTSAVNAKLGGYYTVCELTPGGPLRCWGDPGNGRMLPVADGASPCDAGPCPPTVMGVGDVLDFDTLATTAALTRDGKVWLWGLNGGGSLGHDPGAGGDVLCSTLEADSAVPTLYCNTVPQAHPSLP